MNKEKFATYSIVPEYNSPEKSTEILKAAESSYGQYKDVLSGQ